MHHTRHQADPLTCKRSRQTLATAALTLLALLIACAPASALTQRGHTYTSSFGTEGEGALSKPGAIAVSQATGDVYVLDRAHDRIVQYSTEGQFISAWGWGVNTGAAAKSYQVCTSKCHPGVAGRGEYQLNNYTLAVAVDNCTHENHPCTPTEDPSVGDVYVLHEYADTEERKELKETEKEHTQQIEQEESEGKTFTENEREARVHEFSEYVALDKLSPEGAPLEEFAYNEKACEKEKNPNKARGGALACEAELETEDAHGLTIATDGTPLLYYNEELLPFGEAHLSEAPHQAPLEGFTVGEVQEGVNAGLAQDARGHFYIGQQLLGPTGKPLDVMSEWETITNETGEPELEEVTSALDDEDTTAVAANPLEVPANLVDEQNDVYVTNLTGVPGNRSSTVAQFSPDGSLLQRLNTPSAIKEAAGVAVDPVSGAVYVTDAATGQVDVFTLEEPGAPTVDSLSVQEVSSESAQLDAEIDPDGAPAAYSFRYSTGTVPAAGDPCLAPCVQTPNPEQAIGEAYADLPVLAQLKPGTAAVVQPASTYHYRVIARNAHGTTESAEASFSTPPATAGSLADGRVWEMVSPPDKQGAGVVVDENPGGLIQAAARGDGISYLANGPFAGPEGSRSLELTQLLSVRGQSGWSSKDITSANDAGSGILTESPPEYEFFSPDLALSLVRPFFPKGRDAQPPLSPPLTAEEREQGQQKTIYVRDDQPLAPQGQPESELYEAARANGTVMGNPGYVPLVSDLDAPGVEWASEQEALLFRSATPDLSHVVIEAGRPLQPGQSEGGLYEWNHTQAGEGTLAPVNLLPDGTLAREAHLGTGTPHSSEGMNVDHALSQDGSRVFWSADGHLYLRDMTKTPAPETIALDTIRGGTGTGPEHAVFHTASADGSRVFFTDEQRLTADAGAAAGKPDLYVCEIAQNSQGGLECVLSDLTPAREAGAGESESASVRAGRLSGGVLGASEDGSYVYFIADGVLCEHEGPAHECVAENAQHEHATPGLCASEGDPQATCNLYVEHYQSSAWQAPRFIASVSLNDKPDWEGEARGLGGQAQLTARVSPNGLYLAFMSDRSLTSFNGVRYDNDATATGAGGAPAEEVYEYAFPSGALQCASCEPSGARPAAVFDPGIEGAHGSSTIGLLVDRFGAWAGKWLAGSLPEWSGFTEGNTQALYQSRYLSDTGRLFFDSPEPLAPGDTNGQEDVYEYEPTGVPQGPHECTVETQTYDPRSEGCVGLISSGSSSQESAFLDASETGGEGPAGEQLSEGGDDVFFVTAAKLVPEDTDEVDDVYDAHECTRASPCIPPREIETPPVCETTGACRSYTPPDVTLGAPASAAPGAPGNTSSQHAVLSNQEHQTPKPTSKPPTRAQRLAKALHTCRSKDKHHKRQRLACERAAHKRYAAPAKKTNSKTRGHARAAGGR